MSERGMKKWAPYKSLPEQEKYLRKLKEDQEKVSRPVMSSDEAEEINEILVNYTGEEILITYWRNEKINTISSVFKKIDVDNKKIVLPDRKTIYFHELIKLERLR
jgi:hypothetical protein